MCICVSNSESKNVTVRWGTDTLVIRNDTIVYQTACLDIQTERPNLSPEHEASLAHLLKHAKVKIESKGAVYLSPLKDSPQEKRTFATVLQDKRGKPPAGICLSDPAIVNP